jgi:predicted phage terminase large subunit-like protein
MEIPSTMLIDYNLPHPNIAGKPLFLLPNITKEQVETATALWQVGRASVDIAEYARTVVDVIPVAHHLVFLEALRGLVDDEYDDLVINTPPGSAKSTYVSHVFPSWFLGAFPHKNVILASHTATLAEKWSRRVRESVSSPAHARVFPASQLSKDSTAVARWTTTQNGECIAAGVGMSILGLRADLVVLDDPLSGFEQASSITQLQKLHEWYKSDLKSRLKPGAKVVVVCQRLSSNDMAGFLIKQNEENPTRRLKVINIPMESNSPDDPMGRPIGQILWPEWYTPEMVADLKKDDFIWRTMWQQQPPSDDGSWVTTEDIQFRPAPLLTPETVCYGMTDLALSVNSGDYTAHFVVAVDQYGDWDIIHGERDRCDPEVSSSDLVGLCSTFRPREWLIDDDNASKVFMPLVATKARSQGVHVPWKPLPMRGQDKETRAAALRGQFKRRKLFMPADAPFAKWLIKELLTFPNAVGSGVDDGVDALSLIGRRMVAVSAPSQPVVKPRHLTVHEMTLDQLFEDQPQARTLRI